MDSSQKANFFYPPGGILIWIIVFLELTVFFAGLIVMKSMSHDQLDMFKQSTSELNLVAGSVNTIILLIGGYLITKSLSSLDNQEVTKHKKYLLATIISGLVFTFIKVIEYSEKISHGLTISYNTFYTFYWLITAFHLLHVLAGIAILMYFYYKDTDQNRKEYSENLEAGAVFWHMCDLIWVVVFAVIYLYWR
jgi:nitric oxide reductase NorE protein